MDTKHFWEDRFSKGINLRTTGHRAFNVEYNRWLYQAQADALDSLLEKNHVLVEGSSLFDVGSGGGFFIEYFKCRGVSKIVGVDIAKTSVELLSKNYPDYRFYHIDMSDKQLLLNETFQLISAFSVMFHIVDDQKFDNALNNMCSLLAPGGYLIICDTFSKSWLPAPKHVRMRPFSAYQNILHSQGVEVVDLLPMYYLLNRVFIPFVGPLMINSLGLGKAFYSLDTHLRKQNGSNFGGMKLLLCRRSMG